MSLDERLAQFISIEEREAEGAALNLPRWQVPLWDAIHAWTANFSTKSLNNHKAALAKRVKRIPSQADAVVLVERVVERALAVERARIRRELLAEAAEIMYGPSDSALRDALDRICPEGE